MHEAVQTLIPNIRTIMHMASYVAVALRASALSLRTCTVKQAANILPTCPYQDIIIGIKEGMGYS
jgi:hypothetical protein